MLHHNGTKRLRTQRLVLRRFRAGDAGAMFDNWASDPKVTQYLTWDPHISPEQSRAVLASWISMYEHRDYYHWAIEYKGQAIGAYQSLLISVDPANTVLGPVYEDAYHECLPLMAEIKHWQDVADDCNGYLTAFPNGKYAAEVRNLKNQATTELSMGDGAKAPAPASGK